MDKYMEHEEEPGSRGATDIPVPRPDVEPPKSPPTGSRFETFDGNFVGGFPDIPEPEWVGVAARHLADEREVSDQVVEWPSWLSE